MALTPCTGSMLDDMYIDLLDSVRSRRSTSHRLLSRSLLLPMEVLQPTPLCQIAYVTLFFAFGRCGMVKPVQNIRSINVSMTSSASGLASSKSSPAPRSGNWSSGCDSSNSTSPTTCPFLVLFRRTPQKNLSSHSERCSAS